MPVQDDRDWRRGGCVQNRVHQKPLSVWSDSVVMAGTNLYRAADARGKQGNWLARFDRLSIWSDPDWNRHQPVIQPDIEQFLAIASPPHLRTPICRNWQFA